VSSIGFQDDNEGTAPCGGFSANFATANFTDFHVGGDTIALVNGHPTTTFLFRVTLDEKASSGWKNMVGAPIQVNGLNNDCNPQVPAPVELVGQKGLLQVIAQSPDGFLYQVGTTCVLIENFPALETFLESS
jgi:hypothetical protein